MKEIIIYHENQIKEKGKEDGSQRINQFSCLKMQYQEQDYIDYCVGYAEGLVFYDMHNHTKSIPIVQTLPPCAVDHYEKLFDIMINVYVLNIFLKMIF